MKDKRPSDHHDPAASRQFADRAASEQTSAQQAVPQDVASSQIADRCIAYLTGELDDQENRAFERQLGENAKLGDELHRQAELLSWVGAALADQVAPAAHSKWNSPKRLIFMAASLAACLIAIVTFRGIGSDARVAENLDNEPGISQVAKAWASQVHQGALITEDTLIADDTMLNWDHPFVDPPQTTLPDAIFGQPDHEDFTLDWMTVAVNQQLSKTMDEAPIDES